MKTALPELQPLEAMPIWARLKFMKMVSETYTDPPRYSSEAVVQGFYRNGDTVWIHYELFWKETEVWINYLWPAIKTGIQDDIEF